MTSSHLPAAKERDEREYSARALFGVAVPQANPIVEPEFSALMPPGVGVIATRLQGSRTDSGNRLVQYLDNLGDSLDAFDTARPDALGYACTGTSYLIGREEERRRIDAFSEARGYPIITSANAILDALKFLGASRVALLAPYPQWMVDASHLYWERAGLTIVSTARTLLDTQDTRNVYRVRTQMVVDAAATLDTSRADVILMSGTGMPTLTAIPHIARMTGRPVLSSNLCLAWALLRAAGVSVSAPRPAMGEALIGHWLEKAVQL